MPRRCHPTNTVPVTLAPLSFPSTAYPKLTPASTRQLITGTGHRQSIANEGSLGIANAATERRRSSAIAPDAAAAAAAHNQHHHSGYDGDDRLAPIQSRPQHDGGESSRSAVSGSGSGSGSGGPLNNGVVGGGTAGVAANNTTSNNGITGAGGVGAVGGEHTKFHDATTAGHDHGDHGLVTNPLGLVPEDGEKAKIDAETA